MRDRVRLSARNSKRNGTTGEVHFLSVVRPLQGRMAKRKKAADEAAIECVLRVVRRRGRMLIEIEVTDTDEQKTLALAATLVRGARD